jgi:hypothetical protein
MSDTHVDPVSCEIQGTIKVWAMLGSYRAARSSVGRDVTQACGDTCLAHARTRYAGVGRVAPADACVED